MAKRSLRMMLLCLLLFNGGLLFGYLAYSSLGFPKFQYITATDRQASRQQTDGQQISAAESSRRADRLKRSLGASFIQKEVSCASLLAGDREEQAMAQKLMQSSLTPKDIRQDLSYMADNCTDIRQRYVTVTLSQVEADFPIAFSLTVFKDFYQVEKLFRAVYRPEHFYCFHVDSKSSDAFYRAVHNYTSCFPNVALLDKRVSVQWGTFSVLEADLNCMAKLLTMSTEWRYFINLAGQEYPLRTMRELVTILKALNGANNLENAGTHNGTPPLSVQLPDGTKRPIKWYKGSVHVTVTRGFVEYALSDVGKQISEHLRKHGSWPCPDETFFATLNHNADVLKVPGADLTGLKTDNVKLPFLNRYKNWLWGVFGYPCLSGKTVRQICIWGVRDLPAMNKRFEFFVNKFYYNHERFALQCMTERFWNNTLADYGLSGVQKTWEIPLSFYEQFEFVRKHL